MHASVMEWGRSVLTPEVVTGKRVLEVGSCDVNGSLQPHIRSLGPKEFLGVDSADPADPRMRYSGVDMVLDANDLVATFGEERWDLVLSTEMLEHCRKWQRAVYQMKASLVPGGLLIITTRSPGYPRHSFPDDFWRFTPEIMYQALGDLDDVEVITDPIAPGVFAIGRRGGPVSLPDVEAEDIPLVQFVFSPTRIWPPPRKEKA